mmetsp:Transcript_29453/g.79510  ORF Transcript_29453/g.79510 Transcript_29453/m.79510 type:complete len:233 (+) Transcript_29453:600-1298(+)
MQRASSAAASSRFPSQAQRTAPGPGHRNRGATTRQQHGPARQGLPLSRRACPRRHRPDRPRRRTRGAAGRWRRGRRRGPVAKWSCRPSQALAAPRRLRHGRCGCGGAGPSSGRRRRSPRTRQTRGEQLHRCRGAGRPRRRRGASRRAPGAQRRPRHWRRCAPRSRTRVSRCPAACHRRAPSSPQLCWQRLGEGRLLPGDAARAPPPGPRPMTPRVCATKARKPSQPARRRPM